MLRGWSNQLGFLAFLSLFLCPYFAQAQVNPGMAILGVQPGSYEVKQIHEIEVKKIDFAQMMQKEDARAYQKATSELYQAYVDLVGVCKGSTCSGMNGLLKISLDTAGGGTEKAIIEAGKLNDAIRNYQVAKNNLRVKVAQIQLLEEVWSGLGKSSGSGDELIYFTGALNLRALKDFYDSEIDKLDEGVKQLQYRVDDNRGAVTTEVGDGLNYVDASLSAEALAQDIDIKRREGQITARDKRAINVFHHALGSTLLDFIDANDDKLYHYNKMQASNRDVFVSQLETSARILQFVRAAACMPLGIPNMEIRGRKIMNLGYLSRGINRDDFNIASGGMYDRGQIHEVQQRFDELFLSAQSQNGELNTVGGMWGILNRVNSSFTWHNQVEATYSVLRILRGMIIDELDVLDGTQEGCNRVRARYEAKWGSLKDIGFARTLNTYLIQAPNPDNLLLAFNNMGRVVAPKMKINQQLTKILIENPAATMAGSLIDGISDTDN